MMDELELLKKDWKKKEENLPKLTYNEIYTMLWKKSSSIVKWLFYISLFELFFWILLNVGPLFMDDFQKSIESTDGMFSMNYVIAVTTLAFIVILLFIYFLYKSYKNISAADNIKTLMESILKTRKVIKYYVLYNLAVMFFSTVVGLYFVFTSDKNVVNLINVIKEEGSEFKFWLIVIGGSILALVFTIGVIWLFYRIIYGILLKKLNHNYKELKRLEI